jgi:cysteine synthase
LEKGAFEGILSIDEDRSLELSRQLVQMGISAGLSSGANLWGAIELAREIKRGQIVTVFPDGMEKYLSTGLII